MPRIRVFQLVFILLVVPVVALAELPPVFVMEWGGSSEFGLLAGVGVGEDGSVYVVDNGNSSVAKVTSKGYLSEWGSVGTGDGQFMGAWGIDVTAGGEVYVTDIELERVQVFDTAGVFLRKWGYGSGSQPGYFRDVVGVAVNESLGYVYTLERENRRVQCFTLDGTFVKQWGAGPSGPAGITVAPNGDVFVIDEILSQVQHFDSTGALQGTWTDAGTLVGASGIAADADGDLYIVSGGNQVLKYTADGTLLTAWTPGLIPSFIDVHRQPGTVVDDIYVVRSAYYMVSHWQWWPRPYIELSAAFLDFGTIAVNSTATDTLLVDNTGDTTLTVYDVTTAMSQYVATPGSFTVEPGGTQPVQVAFTPDTYGVFNGALQVLSDDPDHPAPGIAVYGAAASPDILVQPDTLFFPDTPVGGSSVDSVFVTNVGDVPLVVSDIATTNSAYVASPAAGFTLAVGDTQWVTVTFQPPTTDNYYCFLHITSDDPDEGSLWKRIQGTGNASDLAFGVFYSSGTIREGGGSVSIAYWLHNQGTGATLPYSVGVYASTDTVITTDDELLATASPGLIDAGESVFVDMTPVPAPKIYGDIYLGVIADYEEAVYELDETNNTAWAPFQFYVPAIYNVRDVPDDQGGFVYMSWYASPRESGGWITEYSLWRAINADAAALLLDGGRAKVVDAPVWSADEKGTVLREAAGGMYFWELVGTQPAYHLPGYGKAMPTMFDSTGTDPEYHYFQVIAHTEMPTEYYVSAPDSARSIDNLAPSMPLNLVTAQSADPAGLDFAWDANTEADLSHYAIYRGDTPDFTPDESNLIGVVGEAAFHDPDWRWDDPKHYKICAVDVHENESPYATAGPSTVTGVDPPPAPLSDYLAQNHPNPFNPVTTIEFGLKSPDVVTLRIYDAAGRLVRTLVDGPLPAKHHTLQWNGVDDRGNQVASGVYFYRMETGTFAKTRKMVLLK